MYTDEITMETIESKVQKVNKGLQRFNSKIFCEEDSGEIHVKIMDNREVSCVFSGYSKELILAYLMGFCAALEGVTNGNT